MAGGKMKKPKRTPKLHVLKNPTIIDSIIEKIGIKNTDVVLEIGAGTGNMTHKLLDRAKFVFAFELDRRMVLELDRRFNATPRLKVIQEDILTCDLPYFDVCVANIPYNMSQPLIFKLLSHQSLFQCAVIILQRDFAQRLIAQPGGPFYCPLSVSTQLLANMTHLHKISKNDLIPPPKAGSSVVRLEPKYPRTSVNFKEWRGLISICFSKKTKTIGSLFRQKCNLAMLEKNSTSLKDLSGCEDLDIASYISALGDAFKDLCVEGDDGEDDEEMEMASGGETKVSEFKDKVLGVLEECGFEHMRACKLSQEDFVHLLSLFNKAGIHFA